MINCIKVLVEHNHKKLLTPENATMLYSSNLTTNSSGKRGYGQVCSMVKILRPYVTRLPKPTTEEAKKLF